MARENSKIIEVGKRKFKIEKFDAFTGSYIAFTLMEKFLPMGLEQKAGFQNMPKNRTLLSREEFIKMQKDCLSVVSEVLPARSAPILNENGSWGVNDIERNTQLVLILTIHSLAFNIADFFGGEGLKELMSSLADIFPADMLTSMATSTPQ